MLLKYNAIQVNIIHEKEVKIAAAYIFWGARKKWGP